MIDEETTTDNATPEAPVAESASKEAAPETTQTDPYAGKSADDLRAMLRDAQKQIGKQSQEVGEVRKLREEMESLKQAIAVRPRFDEGYQPPIQQQAPPQDEFDFSNVPGSVEKLVERKLSQRDREFAQRQAQQDAQDAQVAFEVGKKIAYKENPELFKGIEQIVEGQLFNAWKVRAANKAMLGDPSIWQAAAVLIHNQKGDLAEVFSRKTVKPVQTETPSARRQVADEGEDIVWSREDRRFMEDNNLSEKEAAEALESARAMRSGGGIRWAGR